MKKVWQLEATQKEGAFKGRSRMSLFLGCTAFLLPLISQRGRRERESVGPCWSGSGAGKLQHVGRCWKILNDVVEVRRDEAASSCSRLFVRHTCCGSACHDRWLSHSANQCLSAMGLSRWLGLWMRPVHQWMEFSVAATSCFVLGMPGRLAWATTCAIGVFPCFCSPRIGT